MDNYIDPLGTDYLFPNYTDNCIDPLGTDSEDLSISETDLQQTSVPFGSGLLPGLLHRHPDNAHDQQLHLLQLPPACPWFLSDWPKTYYYPVHQHNPEDQLRVVVIDSYALFSLVIPPRFDFENWHVFKWLVYNFIYSIFPMILNLVLTFTSSMSQWYLITDH